jgi:hypothetical protein
MKRILLLSLLLLPIVALAQYPTFSNKQKLGVQTTGDGLIFRGNLEVPNYIPSNVNNAYFYLDTVRNTLKFYKDGWIQIYPSPQFDTTTLNVYLKISDTTAMLLPYFRDSDTTSLNLINRFALKLNISDTATMLTPYMKKADTISLSNRIDLKLNISDTTILSNRITTNANNIITINNKLATKLDTIYVKFKDVVTMIENKDTINIGSSLTDGYAINIIGDSVNIDTVILDNRYPDRDSTNELQDITFATTAGIVTISGGKVMNIDTLYNSVIDSVNLLIRDSIAAFTPLTEGYGINIIGDSINVDTSIIFTQSDTITLSNRIDLKLNTSDTITLSNRIDTKLNASDTVSLSNRIDLKFNISDTLDMLTPYFRDADTSLLNLTNRFNTKLNISDTTDMLAPYLREADTISLSNRINTKLDTIYVNYQTNVDVVTNKDTINIIPLTEGFGINIIGDSINIDSAVILETQQKQIAYVKNMSGVTMYKGQAVYSSGSTGDNKLVELASSNTEQASSKTFGIVETDSIPNGSHGYIITFGLLSGINTNAFTEGLTVYLSNTPGQLTSVKPIAPLHMVTIGICIRQQQNNGSIFVKIQNGFEFDELHDVRITTPVDKASIYYNLSENLWRDTTATLLISDTASMLNPYLRKLDTISLSNRIDLRVKYADTTNMLLPYFRTNDTTLLNLNSRLSTKLNLSDTANMLSKYVNTYSNQIDINGNKTFNNVVTIDSATVTGKLLINTNISDAVKINSNTNSTNLELMNNNGTVSIKSTNRNMVLQTDTTALMYLNGETNRVGILTMTPEQALQVAGTIRVDSLVNNLTPDKLVGANNANDLTDIKIGNGLSFSNDTLKVADNIINSGDTATLLRQDFLGINTNVLTWQQGSKKLLPYFTQVYRNGQLLKSESQYTITNDSIVTLATGSYKLDDNITIIAIDNIVALAGSGGIITLQGDVTGSGTNSITTTIGANKVTNTMLAGSISNDKLNTITTAGKISNSATTATNSNTGNTIVSRDASGNFSAGTITASLNGNANTATTLATGRTIAITGDLTYTSPSFNGSTNVTAVGTLANSGVTANTYTAATVTVDAKGRVTSASSNTIPTVNNGTLTMAVSGNGLTGSQTFTANQSTAATFTVTSTATNSNTPSTIVYRDASGNFSAGNITASNFLGNATSSTNSTNTTNVLNYLNSNEIFKFKTTNATNVSGQILVTTPGTDFSIARNDAAQTFTGTQTFSNTIIGNISGNAATATNVAYSGLTGTVPIWNQNTTGNAATVTTNANLTGDVTSIGNATSITTGVIVNADINASAAIAVSKLAASTISGVTLGNNLNTLTISSPLTGTSYNGSSAITIGLQAATTSVAGSMSAADKTKLDGIAAGAQVNVPTNLAQGSRTTTTVPITSSTGTTATLNVATTSLAGVMSSADKAKLDGIASGATANTGTVTSVAALTLTTTGTDVSSSVATGTTTPVITLNIPNASSTNRGVLTSTDWTTFNNKQNALGFTPANSTITINTTSPLQGGGNLSANRTLSILSASDVQSGIVNTTAQLFSGNKVFKHRLTADSLFYLNNTSPIPTAILGIDLTGGVNSVGKFTLGNGLSINSSTLLADTNLLVTRFDTASMLTPYFRDADTSQLNLTSRFNTKQNTLVSGTNIKTVNSNSLLGSGNISVGTVTSVGGTGTVSGLTLTGSVTNSGNLTLGGTLSLTSSNVTTALGYTPYNSTNPNGYIRRTDLSFAAGSGNYDNINGVITIPTNNNQITNGAGYITSSSLSSYLPLTGGTLTGKLSVLDSISIGSLSQYTGNFTRYLKTANVSPYIDLNIGSVGTIGTWRGRINFQTSYNTEVPTTAMTINEFGNINMNGTLGVTSNITANSFIKSGGTSSQFLKADGTVDGTSYLPLTGGTLTGGLIGTTGSFGMIGGYSAWESDNFRIQPYNNYPSEDFGIVFNSLSATETMDFYWFGYSEQPRRAFRFIDGSTDSEKMRIEPFTGNVGINQTVPSYKLDVNGTLNATGAATLGSSLTVEGATVFGSSSAQYDFRVSSGTNVNMIFMDASENKVGIGTASPTKTLDVNGELNVNSVGTFGGRINTPWLERTYTNTTSSNFTVSVNTTWLDVNTNVLTTLTLPNASTYPGKELHIRQTGTGQIISFSSNVIPFTSPPTGSAGTAILNPTNNKAVTLVSDGTNWIIMQRSGN